MSIAGPARLREAKRDDLYPDVVLGSGVKAIGELPRLGPVPPAHFWLDKLTIDGKTTLQGNKSPFKIVRDGKTVTLHQARLRSTFSSSAGIRVEYVGVDDTLEHIEMREVVQQIALVSPAGIAQLKVEVDRRAPEQGSLVTVTVVTKSPSGYAGPSLVATPSASSPGSKTLILQLDTSGPHFSCERFEMIKMGIQAWHTALQFQLQISPIVAIPRLTGSAGPVKVLDSAIGRGIRANGAKKRYRKPHNGSDDDFRYEEEDEDERVRRAPAASMPRPKNKRQAYAQPEVHVPMVPIRWSSRRTATTASNPVEAPDRPSQAQEQNASRSESPEMLEPERAARELKSAEVQVYKSPASARNSHSIINSAELEYLPERIAGKRETLRLLQDTHAFLVVQERREEEEVRAATARLQEARTLRERHETSIRKQEKEILADEKHLSRVENGPADSQSTINASVLRGIPPIPKRPVNRHHA
ncbi:hypothetical protein ACM66B_001472 [Microbotryomycetes sp. NB124-2]